ncbi:MAG: helix-turn-helix domain-containing protein [Caldivirga sp.]
MQPPLGEVMVIMTMMEVFLIMALGYMIYDIKVRLTKGNPNTSNEAIEAGVHDNRVRLNTDEVRVLRYLLSRSNKPVVQSMIGRDLNIPKSTLFRIVRRLNELGLINVEKRGKYKYIYIQRVQDVVNILKAIDNELTSKDSSP